MPVCAQCGCTEVEVDPQRGISSCVRCGAVVEENTIVSEITFQENASGSSSVVGQFVSSTGFSRSMGIGGSKESRELTIQKARRRISRIASMVNMNARQIDSATRLFILAINKNFVQGRKADVVYATCLYVVCRRDHTHHLLIDFSDALQINVFTLGACFLKFCRCLNLHLSIVDPSLYIHRFAAGLEFGEKTHDVVMTALRIVARMKRDWINTGRSPAGICGGALLIASRIHNFRRTQAEIVAVVKVCDHTLRNRLKDFSMTPAAQLSAEEFEKRSEKKKSSDSQMIRKDEVYTGDFDSSAQRADSIDAFSSDTPFSQPFDDPSSPSSSLFSPTSPSPSPVRAPERLQAASAPDVLDMECDPPAFRRLKLREALERVRAEERRLAELKHSTVLIDAAAFQPDECERTGAAAGADARTALSSLDSQLDGLMAGQPKKKRRKPMTVIRDDGDPEDEEKEKGKTGTRRRGRGKGKGRRKKGVQRGGKELQVSGELEVSAKDASDAMNVMNTIEAAEASFLKKEKMKTSASAERERKGSSDAVAGEDDGNDALSSDPDGESFFSDLSEEAEEREEIEDPSPFAQNRLKETAEQTAPADSGQTSQPAESQKEPPSGSRMEVEAEDKEKVEKDEDEDDDDDEEEEEEEESESSVDAEAKLREKERRTYGRMIGGGVTAGRVPLAVEDELNEKQQRPKDLVPPRAAIDVAEITMEGERIEDEMKKMFTEEQAVLQNVMETEKGANAQDVASSASPSASSSSSSTPSSSSSPSSSPSVPSLPDSTTHSLPSSLSPSPVLDSTEDTFHNRIANELGILEEDASNSFPSFPSSSSFPSPLSAPDGPAMAFPTIPDLTPLPEIAAFPQTTFDTPLGGDEIADSHSNSDPISTSSSPPSPSSSSSSSPLTSTSDSEHTLPTSSLSATSISISSSTSSSSSSSSSPSAATPSSSSSSSSSSNYDEGDPTTWTDIADSDVTRYICTRDEAELKGQIWDELYLEFFAEMEKKAKEKREKAEAKLAAGGGRRGGRRGGYAGGMGVGGRVLGDTKMGIPGMVVGPDGKIEPGQPLTATDIAASSSLPVLQKKVSTKLDYGALQRLFEVDPQELSRPSIYFTDTADDSRNPVDQIAQEEEQWGKGRGGRREIVMGGQDGGDDMDGHFQPKTESTTDEYSSFYHEERSGFDDYEYDD